MQDFDLILKLLDIASTAGVLLWIVWQFQRGTIIPKSVVDKMLEMYEDQAKETFKDIMEHLDRMIVICPLGFTNDEIRNAVKDAFDFDRGDKK